MSSTGDHVNPLDLPEDEQVIYELGEWPIDLQAEAAEVLAESQIPHAWDGTDLVVHVDWEQTVDELLDAVERGATGEVDTSDDEILYELDEWSADDRLLLSDRLDEEGIAHHWDGETTLVIAPIDEASVEAVLDGLDLAGPVPDGAGLDGETIDDEAALGVESGGADPTDDPSAAEAGAEVDDADASDEESDDELGVGGRVIDLEEAEAESFEVLSALFLAADRLKGNPLDPEGIANLADALEDAHPDVPPYGIVPGLWRDALDRANRLADALADPDDRSSDVMPQAAELQAILRPYV
jgi:hypothetical protein